MNQTNPIIDQTLFDLKLNEAELYTEQGLLVEADNIYKELLAELKVLPDSKNTAFQIKQLESLRINKGKDSRENISTTPHAPQKKSDEDLYLEATALKSIESYNEAIKKYKKLIDRNFKLHDLIYALIVCYKKMGEQKKAERYLSSLIKDSGSTLDKKDICHYFLSFLNEENADYVTALQLLNSVRSPNNFHDYFNRKKALESKIKGRTKFDYLLSSQLIGKNDLKRAQNLSRKNRKSIEYVLIHSFDLPAHELGKSLSMYYGYPFIDLSKESEIHNELFSNLKYEYLKKNHWAPLSRSLKDGKIKVVIDNPDMQIQQDINKFYIGINLEFLIGVREHIDDYIDNQFSKPTLQDEAPEEDVTDFLDGISNEFDANFDDDDDELEDVLLVDNKVIMFVNKMIMDATRKKASDIHIEPSTHSRNANIRFRVDGICQPYIKIPNSFSRPVISRLKIMARMDITERRKPKDGKIKFRSKSTGAIELRVATIPTSGSKEDVVLRLLRSGKPMSLDDLGILDYISNPLLKIIQKPHGLLLVVGPTGSGKTTTLHSALNVINTPEKKIWTAEDPVEIDQEGIRQAEVHNKIGLDFSTLLRSFLRADPDVIMVGEMRDIETTKTAIEASLTGHLVFSTLHTNNAPETVTRLLEMDIDPANFADSLLGILAQRLGRTLCTSCKEPEPNQKAQTDKLISEFGKDPAGIINRYRSDDTIIFQPKGCPACDNTGYLGRIGFHEFLLNNYDIRQLIKEGVPTEQIRKSAFKADMCTLKQDGILKVFKGLTDLTEVKRNCI
ncbi:MAG: Flp pilus assembly complex ATPase component [Desulfobacteraceae bacterium]|nr:Flp pilus assembly complex ATPase component [Desulfobacteraceae bacterium]